MIKLTLGELLLTSDAVHDLNVVLASYQIGDEGEEVDRFPVEAQRIQTPQSKGGVADPGEAIVVVAVPSWCFRKRRRAGGGDGAGRGVGQPLERQCAAL